MGSRRLHLWIASAFAILVTLAGVQLIVQRAAYGMDSHRGPGGWLWLFGANLVASLPWLPAAYGISWWTRRRPPTSARRLVVHGLTCAGVTLGFLCWLSLFHGLLPGGSDSDSFGELFLRNLGDFAVVCVVLYWLIVAASKRFDVAGAGDDGEDGGTAGDRPAEAASMKKLVIPAAGKSRLLDPSTILWIEADEGYARLETEDGAYLLRRSLHKLASDLEPLGFARIHRSTIVRLDRVEEVRRLSHGEAVVRLREGREFKVSRTYREALEPLGV